MSDPKILIIDIEVAPAVAEVWSLWDQRIGLSQLQNHPYMLCFAAKWYKQPKVLFYSVHHDGQQAMVQAARDLVDEADILVHYNGQQYDVPHVKREILLAGLTPPSPVKQIDLYKVSKSQFRWLSNKLQYVSTQLGLEGKAETGGHELWTACMSGDAKAWNRMRKYNKQDVVLTEEVYAKLLPWIVTHPHVGLFNGSQETICPKCGSDHYQRRGLAHTSTQSYARYQCQECFSWFRGTSVEQRVGKSRN